jgi:hypothetical protein
LNNDPYFLADVSPESQTYWQESAANWITNYLSAKSRGNVVHPPKPDLGVQITKIMAFL